MDGSDVSVVLPTYQDGLHLVDALASIAAQTVRPSQVVVADDGSTDDTPTVVAEFAATHPELEVQFLATERNEGVAAARNRGLEVATGSWVAMQDSDDVWLPSKLERQLAFVDSWTSNRRLVAVGTWGLNVNERLEPVSSTRSGPVGQEAYDEARARGQIFFCLQASLLLRREDLLAIGGYRDDYYGAEDLEMLDRIAQRGVITVLPEELVLYRKRLGTIQSATARRPEVAIDRLSLNVRRRAQGRPDLSVEEHARLRASEPWRRRWVRRARVEGKHHYRLGSVMAVNGERVRGTAHLVAAALLDPQRVRSGVRTALQGRARRS